MQGVKARTKSLVSFLRQPLSAETSSAAALRLKSTKRKRRRRYTRMLPPKPTDRPKSRGVAPCESVSQRPIRMTRRG